MADLETPNREAYDAIRNIIRFMMDPRQKQRLANCPKVIVAMSMMYVAEELMTGAAQEEREKAAVLAYQVADQLGARIDDDK